MLYPVSRTFDIFELIFRRRMPGVRFALPVIQSTCGIQEREQEISTPKIPCTYDRLQDLAMQYVISFTGFLDPVTCTTWHFEGLNPISHLVSHADKMLRSFYSVVLSFSLSIVRYKAVALANSRTWEHTSLGRSFI